MANMKFKVGDKVKSSSYSIWEGKDLWVVGLGEFGGYFCSPFNKLEPIHHEKGSLFFYEDNLEELEEGDNVNKPDGGPAEYYDFPKGAVTLNDLIEFKSMDFHRGNIFKACWRWGEKAEVSKDYDARKIIYSGARLLKQLVGVKEMRDTLQKMLDDPQFKESKDED